MLLVTIWMVMADHLRPWKEVQREFQLVEREKLKASDKEKQEELKYEIQEPASTSIAPKIEAAEARRPRRQAGRSRKSKTSSRARRRPKRLDMERRFKKTELDSKRSLYDGMIDRDEEREARVYLADGRGQYREGARSLSKEFEEGQAKLKAKKEEKEKLLGHVDHLKKEKETAHARGRPRAAPDRAERRPVRRRHGEPGHASSAACPASTSCPRPRSSRSAFPSC